MIQRERGWLDLAALRFYTHPGLRHVLVDFLIDVYHGMRAAVCLMEVALARSRALSPGCPVATGLVEYWIEHIRDESGHDEWLLDDLRCLGIDAERARSRLPGPAVAEVIGTLHFWVLHTHPLAAVPYFYIAERGVPNARLVDRIATTAGVRPECLRTFYRHAVIDATHGRELKDLVDVLPLTSEHRALMNLSAVTVLRQVTRNVETLLRRAEEGHRAAESP